MHTHLMLKMVNKPTVAIEAAILFKYHVLTPTKRRLKIGKNSLRDRRNELYLLSLIILNKDFYLGFPWALRKI